MISRVLGEKVAVSVATAIPLEEKLLVEKLPVKELWINVHTLFRNLYEAYEDPAVVPRGELISELSNEALVVRELLHGIVNVTYYNTDITSLERNFPLAKIKVPKTPKQKIFANNERLAIAALMNNPEIGVLSFKQKIYGKNAKAWILTHYPLDLLSQYEFSELSLISSHTGDIKKPVEWIKKLTNNENYHKLPFNILTLQILGDGAVQFFALPPSIKKHFIAIAEAGKWKPTTSRDKVLSDINKYDNPEIKKVFLAMLRTKLI